MSLAETIAHLMVGLAVAYGGLGLIFAAAFVRRGVERLDPGARGASWAFRAIIVPGVVLFWPLLLGRWFAGAAAPPSAAGPHDRAAAALGERTP